MLGGASVTVGSGGELKIGEGEELLGGVSSTLMSEAELLSGVSGANGVATSTSMKKSVTDVSGERGDTLGDTIATMYHSHCHRD